MFGLGFTKELKGLISIQDNTIKRLRDELTASGIFAHNKQLEVTRLSAENAVMKIKINNLEDEINVAHACNESLALSLKKQNIWQVALKRANETENPTIYPKLQAYYNRGRKVVVFNNGRAKVDKKTGEAMAAMIAKPKPVKLKKKSKRKSKNK